MIAPDRASPETPSIPSNPTFRSPLIFILIPLLWGYLLAEHTALNASSFTLLFTSITCLLLAALSTRKPSTWKLWFALFPMGICLLSAHYYRIAQPPTTPDTTQLPPREALLTIEVRRPFDTQPSNERTAGIGIIQKTPEHLNTLIGHRVAYYLNTENHPTPYRTMHFKARGMLTHKEHFDINDDNAGFYRYLDDMSVHLKLTRGSILETMDTGHAFYRFCQKTNHLLTKQLTLGVDPQSPSAGILPAIVLGKKSLLSQDQKDRFIHSGTMHFFAISGLHVGIVAGALYALLAGLGIRHLGGALLGLCLVFIYVHVTGGTPSAIRAFMMVAFFWLARALTRQPVAIPALVASAIAVLLWEPDQLWSPGFQLSYAVVAALLLYGAPLSEAWQHIWEPERFLPAGTHAPIRRLAGSIGRWAGSALAISLAATLVSSPLIAYYFGVASPGGILLNIVLFSLIGVILICGLLSAIAGMVLPAVSALLNPLLAQLITGIQALLEQALKIPGLFLDNITMTAAWGLGGCLWMLLAMLLCTAPFLQRIWAARILIPILANALFWGVESIATT